MAAQQRNVALQYIEKEREFHLNAMFQKQNAQKSSKDHALEDLTKTDVQEVDAAQEFHKTEN